MKKTILSFYSTLQEKDLPELYKMESPSFRYLYSYEKYAAYYKGFKPIKKIVLVKLEERDPDLYESTMLVVFPDLNATLKDLWLKVDGHYYHHTVDPFFFPR
ncbi:MAG: hypothetical protein GXO19_04500 [Epsilonproteobacteria bacterium]|nr:hypothetical protein [Campylobacterota bacterium]NPA56983.1 hypothetical protein [Campylobacterota bacterium]